MRLLLTLVLALVGCDSSSDDDESVKLLVHRDGEGAWMATVLLDPTDRADGFWDGLTASVGDLDLPRTGEEDRGDAMWPVHTAALADAPSPGDVLTYTLDHPDLGPHSMDVTLATQLEDVEFSPSLDEWAGSLLDDDPNNDLITVTGPALSGATDFVVDVQVSEVGSFITFPVQGARFEVYEEDADVAVPADVDSDDWAEFKDALYAELQECSQLKIRLGAYWQWDNYSDWNGVVVEAKNSLDSVAFEGVLTTGSSGVATWSCDCTCTCDGCEGTELGLHYGEDLTCDDLCPAVCDGGGSLCGDWTGASSGTCEGPIGGPEGADTCGGGTTGDEAPIGQGCSLTGAGSALLLPLLLAGIRRR